MNRAPLALFWILSFVITMDRALGQTTSPETTPAGGSAGAVFKLSFVIDGIAYVATCAIHNTSMTNCTFDKDHGLNVTRISATGTTTSGDPPVYFQIVVYATLALVVVLGILAIVAYTKWKNVAAGYQPMPAQYRGFPEQPSAPQYAPEYYGQAAQASGPQHKVIHVGLVRPSCLPAGEVMIP